MRKYIIYGDNLKPGCCRALHCNGPVQIQEHQAYYFKSDNTFMCVVCFREAFKLKIKWTREGELIAFKFKASDNPFHPPNEFETKEVKKTKQNFTEGEGCSDGSILSMADKIKSLSDNIKKEK